jgi:predicted SAM-dependent methyltransferase
MTNIFTDPTRLLHVAPERRLEKHLKAISSLDYLTADLLDPDVMTKMDVTKIQFADNEFDAILCNHVLEHVPDDRKAMRELNRVLKFGGWAMLQVPISNRLQATYEDWSVRSPIDRLRRFGQEDHVRVYGADYVERLTEAGFRIDVIDWTLFPFFGGSRNMFGLNPHEKIFLARKVHA